MIFVVDFLVAEITHLRGLEVGRNQGLADVADWIVGLKIGFFPGDAVDD